eukprot:TRINITY_DN7055_c0_g1_i1.p1 TRINITY_DN7055_c0_g1~~TRINITY_DN7055_c0_g1_i1.p1  ORF type:complete len:102 (-),score=4.62 TRINITY_DN7055_c0_g1_i1:329-634(-)
MIDMALGARSREGLGLSEFLFRYGRWPNILYEKPRHFATAFHARQILVGLDPPTPLDSPLAIAINCRLPGIGLVAAQSWLPDATDHMSMGCTLQPTAPVKC